MTSFERLHYACLRLYVVALYLPIIRPALRFFAHAAPEPQAPRQRTIMPGCGVRWRSPMHGVVECQEHRDSEHWWHGDGEHYAWVDDFWLLAYMVPGSEET